MVNEQSSLNGSQTLMVLTREEEEFLVEAEQSEQKKPCFDARALRQMGLTQAEISLLQLFFMKARGADFNVHRFTKLETLRALVSALKYLPKTDATGKISLASYKASDNIYSSQTNAENWHEGFRYEFGHALIWSHKERREPVLLTVLAKILTCVEKLQKAYGLYQELPQWLRDGMQGDFRADSWIGSDFYEGDKKLASAAKHGQEPPIECPPQAPLAPPPTPPRQQANQATLFSASTDPSTKVEPRERDPPATEKQKALLKSLMAERNIPRASYDIDNLTRKEASRQIDILLQSTAARAPCEVAA